MEESELMNGDRLHPGQPSSSSRWPSPAAPAAVAAAYLARLQDHHGKVLSAQRSIAKGKTISSIRLCFSDSTVLTGHAMQADLMALLDDAHYEYASKLRAWRPTLTKTSDVVHMLPSAVWVEIGHL